MNLFETLKQFKNISPDSAYKEKSKRAILATTPREPLSAWRFIAHLFETGIAVALAVFFILIITGQFSAIPYVSPVKFSVIDPETLHAEAQAVDIQIQLAQVAYEETTSTPTSIVTETTPQIAAASGTSAVAGADFAPTALRAAPGGLASSSSASAGSGSSPANGTSGSVASSSATSTPVSVDQALQELSK